MTEPKVKLTDEFIKELLKEVSGSSINDDYPIEMLMDKKKLEDLIPQKKRYFNIEKVIL